MNAKQLMICAAIIEILQIFADTEIGGQYEIDYDKIDAVRGMDISFITTATTDEEAKELLTLMGAPFER